MLAVIETHPNGRHTALYRLLQERYEVPVTAIDASVGGLGAALVDAAPAAVLLTGHGSRAQRRAWAEAWRRGYPILYRGDTADLALDRGHRAKSLAKAVALRFAYRTCARCLYTGEPSHAHFRRLAVPDSRLVFSPCCVDTTPFDTSDAARDLLRPATRATLGIADDRLVLLVSGNLSDRHGIDQAIAAARALPDDLRCRAVLVFVGQGGRREALVATACLPPAVDVRFAGFQDQSALSRFYHAADLLVVASRPDDTWGLAVNEALHHGLPCVVSPEVGCGPDLVQAGRTGERASAVSPAALAGAIAGGTALIGRPEVRDDCRERAALYSLEPAAAGIARAYHDVAAAGAGAPSYALR